jgi:hypothetical protein
MAKPAKMSAELKVRRREGEGMEGEVRHGGAHFAGPCLRRGWELGKIGGDG